MMYADVLQYYNLEEPNFRKKEEKLWRSEYGLDNIRKATDAYLLKRSVRESPQKMAKILLDRRRLRAKTPQWESFAFGVLYKCKHEQCETPDCIYENRDELIAHMQKVHKLYPPGPDNIGE